MFCACQEDILELFGDIGALRRAKMVNPGHAEVTFINKADAARWHCCVSPIDAHVAPQGRGDLSQQTVGWEAYEMHDGWRQQVGTPLST